MSESVLREIIAEKIEQIAALENQITALANFIVAEMPGEPSQSEGAVECAIRLLRGTAALKAEVERRRKESIALTAAAHEDSQAALAPFLALTKAADELRKAREGLAVGGPETLVAHDRYVRAEQEVERLVAHPAMQREIKNKEIWFKDTMPPDIEAR